MKAIPDLVAHRGYALHYPENTRAAIRAALAAGAKYFECDVQLTAYRFMTSLRRARQDP